jgi:hypothetical protein
MITVTYLAVSGLIDANLATCTLRLHAIRSTGTTIVAFARVLETEERVAVRNNRPKRRRSGLLEGQRAGGGTLAG